MFTECMEVSGTVLRLSTCLSEIISLTLPTSFEVNTILTSRLGAPAVRCLACGCMAPGVGAGSEPRLLAFPFLVLHPKALLSSGEPGLWAVEMGFPPQGLPGDPAVICLFIRPAWGGGGVPLQARPHAGDRGGSAEGSPVFELRDVGAGNPLVQDHDQAPIHKGAC